jgi:uncharacterized protein YqjF (DUF2071 family)
MMLQRWEWMSFLHWRYDPAVVRSLLPPGLEVETFDGSAWVGLLPFRMRVRFAGMPAVPWLSTFPETNVRTYVRGPDGGTGIWFLSLEAARLVPALTGRTGLALPYTWARMEVRRSESVITYRSTRLWPGPRGAGTAIRVEPGEETGIGPLEDFLVSRFRLYARVAGRLVRVAAEHEPWSLRSAHIVDLEQDLLQADGLPPPQGPPLAHFSEGVDVRIAPPAAVARPSAVRGRGR